VEIKYFISQLSINLVILLKIPSFYINILVFFLVLKAINDCDSNFKENVWILRVIQVQIV